MSRVVASVVLWLPFTLIVIVIVVPTTLVAIWMPDEEVYARRMLLAMDRLSAAALGWSGNYTISAELYYARTSTQRFFKWLLDSIEKDHCLIAARREMPEVAA